MTTPPEFQKVSKVVTLDNAEGVLPSEEMELLGRVAALLIFCNIFDPLEMKLAKALSSCITELGDAAPPTILVPHIPPEFARQSKNDEFVMLAEAVNSGIDCAISGGYEGLKLAFLVRAELKSHASKVDFFNKALDTHRERVNYAQDLEDTQEEGVWDYGRVRMNTDIPCADYDLGELRPGLILGDFQVAREVGQGCTGKVYALVAKGVAPIFEVPSLDLFPFDSKPKGDEQVLKTILKKHKTNVRGLAELRNEIKVMKLLSSGCRSHPNIVRLHEVYHSETHIMFRMDDGGPRDLYKCLRAHEARKFPLGAHKAKAVILQCANALCHLHLVANVVHRDIKPENIIIRETEMDIDAKIADFDLAGIISRKPARSTFYGGTFPFMAPEMSHDIPYEPFAADIWSMAIVFLEILCCRNILAVALAFPRLAADDPQKRIKQQAMTNQIQKFFETAGCISLLLSKFCGPELEELVQGDITELLSNEDGMLAVQASQRLTAEEIRSAMGYPDLQG